MDTISLADRVDLPKKISCRIFFFKQKKKRNIFGIALVQNQSRIEITIFRYIYPQTELRLVLNQSESGQSKQKQDCNHPFPFLESFTKKTVDLAHQTEFHLVC